MADSERSEDRDSEVPDPQAHVVPGKAGQSSTEADPQGHEEPDHGVASLLTWIKLGVEAITAVATLAALIYGLVNGNGG
ncbi:hypothetical protein AB0467_09550 [Streptomyces sp. NPDC052095]|uniref:hypothetical protein n=1 Tax=unclassified Streptomyces TaxID=2593676 RepID=UPI00344F066C